MDVEETIGRAARAATMLAGKFMEETPHGARLEMMLE